MKIEYIAIIVSILSLVISLKEYFIHKPKLKIKISDKNSDAYYGMVCVDNDKIVNTMIGAVQINIVNNSPVEIFIKDIKLKIGKNYHRIVYKNNPYWEDVYFFYYMESKEKIWDGSGINYKLTGISTPAKVNPYTILSGICLFHDFPNIDLKYKYGKIVLYTVVGKITKRIKFLKYNENYISTEMKDFELYGKNMIQ